MSNEKVIVRDHWHVWKDDGKRVEYIGGFYSETAMGDALAWKNSQPKGERDQYTVTNKGPIGIVREHADDPDAVMADPVKRRLYEEASKSYQPDGTKKHQPYSATIRPVSGTTTRRGTVTTSRKPVSAPQTPVRTRPAVQVDADLAKVAQAELERHKADERADLEQGINR